jgi:Lrp/AsnC family transcriptional regulator for asnA, asnC and gidA
VPGTYASPVFPYDEIDRRIIALLQKDGRMSNTAIAKTLGLAEATVRRRINRLVEAGTLRIVAVPSPHTAGLTLSAIIGVSCDLAHVAQTITEFTETRYLGYSTGTYDLMIEAFFYSHQHLLDFLTKKIAAIQGVTRTETAIILKVAKFSFEWELPLEELEG